MTRRLQVSIPPELYAWLSREAQRNRVSKGEWVRRVLEEAVERSGTETSAVDRLANLNAPTANIEQMLHEIHAGRSAAYV